MEMRLSYTASLKLLDSIPHAAFQKARENNWRLNPKSKIEPQSICWLFCWAKTGMGSEKAKRESEKVFDELFGKSKFLNFDLRIGHNCATWARYKHGNEKIEQKLCSKFRKAGL
jgi:hypothetical protein